MYPLDFDFNIRLRAKEVAGTLEKCTLEEIIKQCSQHVPSAKNKNIYTEGNVRFFFVARKRKIRWLGPLRFSTLSMLLSVFIVGTENKIYPKNIIILVIRLLEQNLQIYLIYVLEYNSDYPPCS